MNQKQNEYSALQTEDRAHETVGTSLCCAWKVAPKTVWIQSHSAQLTKKLKQVTGYKEVASSVLGGYLRTLEFRKSLAWARSWIERHTAANEAFLDLEASRSDESRQDASRGGQKAKRAHKSKRASVLKLEPQDERRMAA